MNYKQKALDHVRSVCPELIKLSFGCRVYITNEQANGTYSGYYTEGEYRHKGRINVSHIDVGHIPFDSEKMQIIGHTPHLEHWLRGMMEYEDIDIQTIVIGEENKPAEEMYLHIFKRLKVEEVIAEYCLTKDGENQDSFFYEAYCNIVGIINP